jgi:hypothetical protein
VYRVDSTVYINRSGAPGMPIVYRSWRGVVHLQWVSGESKDVIQIAQGTSYVALRGLLIDGGNTADAGIKCIASHHVVAALNLVQNTGGSGISSSRCDYLTINHNGVYHVGYRVGWGSGISLNRNTWADGYQGFHSYVTNNIISGAVDESYHHSDGNGIIVDRGGGAPAVLVANNLVYQNGGRCVHVFHVQHVWVLNNTCYMNGLDERLGVTGEFTSYDAQDVHLINNVAIPWTGRHPYSAVGGTTIVLAHNVAFGGGPSVVPAVALADPSALLSVDPRLRDPPAVDASAPGQWTAAVPPTAVGARFRPRAGSPLLRLGVDPRTQPGVTLDLRKGIERFVRYDMIGRRRWVDGRFSVGAYSA